MAEDGPSMMGGLGQGQPTFVAENAAAPCAPRMPTRDRLIDHEQRLERLERRVNNMESAVGWIARCLSTLSDEVGVSLEPPPEF